jgi:enamine deaminase RidA (YjgF/YER057c/UK114 family)
LRFRATSPDCAWNYEEDKVPNRFLTPETMPAPFGYSQVVESTGTRIVHVAGQVPLNAQNDLVGEGDFQAQVRQAFENVRLGLEAVGMTFNDVVKMQFFLTDMTNLPQVRSIRDEYINTDQPPASTSVQVVALYRPEVMFEMDVVAIA